MQFAWLSLVWVVVTDFYVRLVSMGVHPRLEHLGLSRWLDVSEIQTIEHDVVVIGAGGAGLRAAIECSAAGPEHRRGVARACSARRTP